MCALLDLGTGPVYLLLYSPLGLDITGPHVISALVPGLVVEAGSSECGEQQG